MLNTIVLYKNIVEIIDIKRNFEQNVTVDSMAVLVMTKFITLTHCGLVTPYGDKDLGQHWLR